MVYATTKYSKTIILYFTFFLVLIFSCKNDKTAKNLEVTIPKHTTNLSGPWFFAEQTESPIDSTKHNYHFIRFTVDEKNNAKGVFYNSPYGTDGSKGSFKSVFDSIGILKSQRKYLAEGELYTDTINFKVDGDKIRLGFNHPNGEEATLPKVDKETYDQLFKAYQKQILEGRLNINNYKRLKSITSLNKDLEFSNVDVENLKFMETLVDLDNDPSKMEYLLYVMNPMLCGSGGCNLYILKEDGSIIQTLTVTRPPIYVDVNDFNSSVKGQWRKLYVYSKGMRVVSPEDGTYPSNPSVQKEIQFEELLAYPEQYQLLMDYLD